MLSIGSCAANYTHCAYASLRYYDNFFVFKQEMCASIGVDPLASSKGFWSEMLGFGDFYYELGVQIIEVCMANSHKTGGLMELGELRDRLIRSRGGSKSTNKQVTIKNP